MTSTLVTDSYFLALRPQNVCDSRIWLAMTLDKESWSSFLRTTTLVSSQDVSNAKTLIYLHHYSLHDNGVLNWVMLVALSLSDDRHLSSCKCLRSLDDFLTSRKISLSAGNWRQTRLTKSLTLIGSFVAICRTSASRDSPERLEVITSAHHKLEAYQVWSWDRSA